MVGLSLGPLARLGAALLGNAVQQVPISRIRVDQVLEPRVRAARIVAARVLPARVRAGQRATLALLLQPWRTSRRTVRLPIRIPDDLSPGGAAAGDAAERPRRLRSRAAGPERRRSAQSTSAARARALLPGLDADARPACPARA